MSTLVQIGLKKIPINTGTKALCIGINLLSARSLTTKLEDLPPKPKPWNYNEKSFKYHHYLFDKTSARFDENTKLIVVEGPIAAGKSKLGKEIAKQFGLLYLPEANLDMSYTNKYGYNLKQLDPMLPPDCRSFDVKDFLKHPKHKLNARMQIDQYLIKYSQYIDALAHIFSTGQGVVLDRCVYSDFVFTEAMYSQKFLSKAAYKKYYEHRDNSLCDILRPHLVIYLDVPVPKVLENIQKRNISYEIKSTALTEQYLQTIEQNYKQKYLKDISTHAELLVYDWTIEGDTEIVVEDIEAIKFDYDSYDVKMKDWKAELEEDYAIWRNRFADNKNYLMNVCNIPAWDCPELLVEAEDLDTYYEVLKSAPGAEYEYGYNNNMGDKWLFKTGVPKRDTLPLIERRME
ncbi:hypothetical protein ABEB36_005658 [Hypothenemus hampei]|uniref:NADH dehydrogenase [ubiquinone] 1 alpha subcomplex subunit 10, mitochondrial n=1 Tax=Hypothenemus hampei TaxID=57062 RepID=A0ABD1F2U0_HYPHA